MSPLFFVRIKFERRSRGDVSKVVDIADRFDWEALRSESIIGCRDNSEDSIFRWMNNAGEKRRPINSISPLRSASSRGFDDGSCYVLRKNLCRVSCPINTFLVNLSIQNGRAASRHNGPFYASLLHEQIAEMGIRVLYSLIRKTVWSGARVNATRQLFIRTIISLFVPIFVKLHRPFFFFFLLKKKYSHGNR